MPELNNNLVQLPYSLVIKKRYIFDDVLVFKLMPFITEPPFNTHDLADQMIKIGNVMKIVIANVLTQPYL